MKVHDNALDYDDLVTLEYLFNLVEYQKGSKYDKLRDKVRKLALDVLAETLRPIGERND